MIGEEFVSQAQRVRAAHPFSRLLCSHGAYKRLEGRAVNAVRDLRQTCHRCKTALVLEIIAAKSTNVIQCTPFEAGDVIPGYQIHIGGLFRCLFNNCLVQAWRQAVDEIDVCGKLAVLFFGDTAGNKDTQVADTLVHGVNDGLARGANIVNAVVKVEDPAQRLLWRGYVVALGAEANNGRENIPQIHTHFIGGNNFGSAELVAHKKIIDNILNFVTC